MKWSEVLSKWESGEVMKFPSSIKNKFQWNTSVLKNNGDCEYKESFRIEPDLPDIQDFTPFQEYITQSKNKYVISFPNLSNDTILIIPTPKRGKNYATLYHFSNNSSKTQQREFWRKVAIEARKFMNSQGKVWISVHGLGVSYLHVRISNKPKYYFDNSLKKE